MPQHVRIQIGAFCFEARFEADAAPRSVAYLAALLPLRGSLLHARWSGEAGWLPLQTRGYLEPENATAYPHPGQVLLYCGTLSEPELLLPYGACAFASRAGALAGNHVLTIERNLAGLNELGRSLLWEGARQIEIANRQSGRV